MPEVSRLVAEINDVWAAGEITPYIYYSYAFTPLVKSLLSEGGDDRVLKRAIQLIEDLATSIDPLVGGLVVDAILEPLLAEAAARRSMFGPNTMRILKEMLK